MRAVASRGLFGATVGSLSYLFYKQAELQELIRDEGDRFLRNFQLEATGPHGSNGLKQTAFDSCMRQYGACVLLQVLPLHSHAMQKPKEGHLAEVLEGITFQGRPLLGPSKRINLDVAGAAIGSALAMPLLFPGSFLAGALVGHSSGYILSMLQSMKQPSVKALLETACSRIAETSAGPRFDADELSSGWGCSGMEATSEDETSAAAGTSGQSSWGSTLSLMLFGPLAMSRRTNSGRRQSDGCDGIAGKNEQKLSTWSSWCFHDIQQLTEGVMPEVAKLMHEVHDASWQSRSESNELLDTDATWRFPELVMSIGILRSAEKLWLPTIREHMLHGIDVESEDAVVLNRAFLVWADAGNQEEHSPFLSHQAVPWPWAGDLSSGFSRSSSHGMTVLVPLIDLPDETQPIHKETSSWDWLGLADLRDFFARSGAQLELLVGSHVWEHPSDEVLLAAVPLHAGDVLVIDNRAWRRLRMHTGSPECRALFLAFEYTLRTAQDLPSSQQDVAFWSAAAFALRVRALISAAGTLLPREMGFG